MKCGGIALAAEDVYMATEFDAFVKKVVMVGRGITGKKEFSYKAVRSESGNAVFIVRKCQITSLVRLRSAITHWTTEVVVVYTGNTGPVYEGFVHCRDLYTRHCDVSMMVLQVEMNVNNSDIRFPNQLLINNEFIDASDGVTCDTINPADNSVRRPSSP